MPWCWSYGCREHVDEQGNYCDECQHVLEDIQGGEQR